MNLFNTSAFAAFINGSYAVSTIFLIGVSLLTLTRYRRATKRLTAIESTK